MAKRKKPEVKQYRFTATCFKCGERFKSDEMIVHGHTMTINDHLRLTSKQYLKGERVESI